MEGSSAIELATSSWGKFSIVAILLISKLSLFLSKVWPVWDLNEYWAWEGNMEASPVHTTKDAHHKCYTTALPNTGIYDMNVSTNKYTSGMV